MSEGFITFRDVSREYRMGEVTIKAVDSASFTIDEGKFTLIVGPSGAGKTTILNMLGGMDKASSGSISVAGIDISSYNKK